MAAVVGALSIGVCVCVCVQACRAHLTEVCSSREKVGEERALPLSLLSHISLPYNVLPIHAMPFKGMVGIAPQTGTKLNMLMPSKGAMEGEKT